MDERFHALDPEPSRIAAPLGAARESMAAATSRFLAIPDDALEGGWDWIGEGGESDVRSGFYIAIQALQGATGELTASLVEGRDRHERRPAAGALAAATTARWELDGVLAPLDDGLLDADPGGEEWTIRQTLAHTVFVQRAYPYFSAWWVGRRDEPDYPPQAPESIGEDLPSEDVSATGSVHDIRRRLEALVDLSMETWRDATQEELDARARWSGFPVPVSFRVGRWGPHIEEHTLQVDKTLAMLGRAPTEVERLVRLLYRSMGRLESAASLLDAAALEGAAGESIRDAAAEVERLSGEVAGVAGADQRGGAEAQR